MKYRYNQKYRRRKTRRKRKALFWLLTAVIIAVGLYLYSGGSSNQNNKKSADTSKSSSLEDPLLKNPLPWPSYGQSAYGTIEKGPLATSNVKEQAVPIASLTKTITALAILEKKPLQPGEPGPSITMTKADVQLFNKYLSMQGSVAPIAVGQKMTQYHAMQAMLMASANNISDTLVIWAFGSMDAYLDYANNMLREMGLNETVVADASGFSPSSVSTAEEMVQVATVYLSKPVLKEITLDTETTIPKTGTLLNYNAFMNTKTEIGVKAGNTDEAGRCFIAASLKSGEVYSIAVVLGAKNIEIATEDSHTILKSGDKQIQESSSAANKSTESISAQTGPNT